jgi:hypothetical protein
VPLIKDVCQRLLGHANDNEVRLLLGTAAAESGLIFRKQHDGGPARGLWQMEEKTALDIFINYLYYREGSRFMPLLEIWLDLFTVPYFTPSEDEFNNHLMNYDDFACAMARIKYLRDPAPIPDTLQGQAEYWKRVYNTPAGSGTVEHYLEMWDECGCEELMRV